MEDIGLVNDRVYAVLDSALVTNSQGQSSRIVKIRNTLGTKEWNGDWSDQSNLWTDEAKDQVNFVAEEDGVFWMSFDDFRIHFSQMFICEYNSNNVFCGQPLPVTENAMLVKMVVEEEGDYTIAMSQKD